MKKVNKFFYIIHFILLAVPLIIFITYYILVANIYFNGKKEVDFVRFEIPEIVKQCDLQGFDAYNSETGQKYESTKGMNLIEFIIDYDKSIYIIPKNSFNISFYDSDIGTNVNITIEPKFYNRYDFFSTMEYDKYIKTNYKYYRLDYNDATDVFKASGDEISFDIELEKIIYNDNIFFVDKSLDFNVQFYLSNSSKNFMIYDYNDKNIKEVQKLYYYDSNKDADIYYNIIDQNYDIAFKKTNERFIYDNNNNIVKYFVSENDVKSIKFGYYDSDIFEIDFKNQLLFEAENDNKYPGFEILYSNEINYWSNYLYSNEINDWSNYENLYRQFYDHNGDLYYKDKHLLTYNYCIIFEGIGYYDFTIMSIIIPIIFAVYILLLSFYILRFKKINKQCKSGEIKPKIFNLFILLDILILSMPLIQFLIIMIMSHDDVSNHIKSFGGMGLEIGVFDFIVFLILSIISIVVAKKSIKDKPIKDVVTKENKSNTENTEVVQNDETAVDNYENLNGTYELTEEAYVQSVFENLKFEDSIVHSKDWKAFKKYASLDDLFVIAIGSKYRSSSTGALIKKIISVVGTILSIVIGLVILFNGSGNLGVAGVAIAIVGYFFFNLLAIKQIGYAETLRQCLWKLPKEDRKFVNRLWNNTFVEILNIILELLLNFMVIPYKFIIIVLTTFIPKLENWGIAKGLNSSVITLPVGYDISSLSSLSEYYRSTKFGEAVSNHIEEKYEAKQEELKRDAETVKAYTIKDADGNSIRVYTKDRHTFYRDEACVVNSIGKSYDNGKTVNIE